MTYNSGRERRVGRAIMTATYTPSAEVLASGMATIPGLFRARARVDPTAPAVEDGERRLSYAELDARVDRLAQGWKVLEPLLPRAKALGRPRTTALREVVNAILYLLRSGCPWRMLPRDFPPRSTVQR